LTQALSRVDALGEVASQARPARRLASNREPGEAFAALLAGLGAGLPATAPRGGPAQAAATVQAPKPALSRGVQPGEAAAATGVRGRSAPKALKENGGAEPALEGGNGLAGSPAGRAARAERGVERQSIPQAAKNDGATAGSPSPQRVALAESNGESSSRIAPGRSEGLSPKARNAASVLAAGRGEPRATPSGFIVEGVSNARDDRRVTVVDMRMKARQERTEGSKVGAARLGATARVRGADDPSAASAQGEAGLVDRARSGGTSEGSLSAVDAARDGSAGGEASGASSWRASYEAPSGSPSQAPGQASTFGEALAARLREGAADMVRSAQIALRDGNVGVIRLRLEPETLGGVKIELKMADKQVSGRIVVESDIAGEAFRSSLDALKDAFAEAGLSTTSLEVEGRNGMASGSDGGRGEGREQASGPYWSKSLRELDVAVPSAISRGRDGLLDVVV